MTDAMEKLKEEKIPFLLCGYSSLDKFFRIDETGPLYLATDASLVSLAKAFDDLQFPGLPLEDASVQGTGRRLVFRCVDSLSMPRMRRSASCGCCTTRLATRLSTGWTCTPIFAPRPSARSGSPPRNGFPSAKPRGWSPAITTPQTHRPSRGEGAMSSRRLPTSATSWWGCSGRTTPRRALHSSILRGSWRRHGRELAEMASVPHGKDFHPEGNVWEHTLATLTHRKRPDVILSLALMLHDSGKPQAPSDGTKRFDGHAEIGAKIAVRFLRRLGFPQETIESVEFLVRYHMMPPALKILPGIPHGSHIRLPSLSAAARALPGRRCLVVRRRGGVLRGVQDLQGVAEGSWQSVPRGEEARQRARMRR